MSQSIAILVRHGDFEKQADTPSAHQPFPLTAPGRSQASEAAGMIDALLRENEWELHPEIHTSNLLRAWQTAEIIVDELAGASQLTGTDHLAERGLGSGANFTLAELEAIVQADPRFPDLPEDWKANSHFRLPLMGAESLLDAGKRVADYLDRVLDTVELPAKGRPLAVVFVGHGAAFRHAAHLKGALAFEEIAALSMYHARPVALEAPLRDPWRLVGGSWKVRPKRDEDLD